MGNNPSSFLILIIVEAILFIWTIILTIKFLGVTKKNKKLFSKVKKGNLENILEENLKELDGTKNTIKKLNEALKKTDKMAHNGIQKVETVRFNPFSDTGGDQSFSVALLDSSDNGVVLTSIHNRTETRVYAKPIQHGVSKYNLSKEEKEVLNKATSS